MAKFRVKVSQIKYHAVLVQNGEIELITPVTLRHLAVNTVKYWKKNRPCFNDSFVYSNLATPKEWAEKIETYWKEYEENHKVESRFNDPDELPFY